MTARAVEARTYPCLTCAGTGEVGTGHTEPETGAPITRWCSTCDGDGVVTAEIREREARLVLDGAVKEAIRRIRLGDVGWSEYVLTRARAKAVGMLEPDSEARR